MKVKEFVKTILKDVTGAVSESNNEKYKFYLPNSNKDGIDFDLAVVLKKGAEGKIGAEIFTVIGAKAQSSISEEVVNRIKFKVVPYKTG
jgi:hypothetical protein